MEITMSKTKEYDLRKYFETLLGSDIDLNPAVVVPIATHTLQLGTLTERRQDLFAPPDFDGVIGPSANCSGRQLLDISGTGKTAENGTVELRLSSFLCRDGFPDGFESPAIIVVTPRAQSPIHATARAQVTSDDRDVAFEVETWNADGSPAANQSFNWSCRIPTIIRID
jgi:hypothetical protein